VRLSIRHSLRPLFSKRDNNVAKPGRIRAAGMLVHVPTAVVLAKARTHFTGLNCYARWNYELTPQQLPGVMGPGFRQDDVEAPHSPAASAFFTAFQNASAAFVERLRER